MNTNERCHICGEHEKVIENYCQQCWDQDSQFTCPECGSNRIREWVVDCGFAVYWSFHCKTCNTHFKDIDIPDQMKRASA